MMGQVNDAELADIVRVRCYLVDAEYVPAMLYSSGRGVLTSLGGSIG
jgi:hypothetical protein